MSLPCMQLEGYLTKAMGPIVLLPTEYKQRINLRSERFCKKPHEKDGENMFIASGGPSLEISTKRHRKFEY